MMQPYVSSGSQGQHWLNQNGAELVAAVAAVVVDGVDNDRVVFLVRPARG